MSPAVACAPWSGVSFAVTDHVALALGVEAPLVFLRRDDDYAVVPTATTHLALEIRR
jgi:hypothetical protein